MSGKYWKRNRLAGLCGKCGLVPPIVEKSLCAQCSEFERKRLLEYKHKNKEKLSLAYKEYRKKNLEKEKLRIARWSRENPEKVTASRKRRHYRRDMLEKSATGEFTAQEWQDCLNLYDGKCLWCGTSHQITIDHIVPLSRGGTNNINNLQPLCVSCNSKKKARTIDFRRVWAS